MVCENFHGKIQIFHKDKWADYSPVIDSMFQYAENLLLNRPPCWRGWGKWPSQGDSGELRTGHEDTAHETAKIEHAVATAVCIKR